MKLLVKNAKLREKDHLVDILIENGKFSKIDKEIKIEDNKDCETVDAQGNLVTPTFVDPHLHIDKAFTALGGRLSKTETLEEAINIMHDIKKNYTVEDVKNRAVRAIKESVKYGATKIRANVDIDTFCGLTALKGCMEAKKETMDIADVQLVAFPQEGIFVDPGTEDLMYEALKMGADVVGGMPASEVIFDESRRHVDFVFELAKKYNKDIDMHIDQTKDPFAQSLEYSAFKTLKENYQGRVTGGHCTSLAYQNAAHARKVIELLKMADFNVCSNPQVLAIMGVDPEPRTRGLTRVRELVDAGVNVAAAQDTICDGFHLYGTGDPLDYGLLMAYQAQYNSTDKVKIVFDMVTENAAKIMRLTDYGIKIGNTADFNIIFAKTESEALRRRPSRLVFKNGKLISKYTVSEEFYA
ncbi:MAG: amidohydrolase family protein [Candidatus Atribacteria bacterium]|nr:amidohydrolase family protein [Candidatus Atribacteria bacterium]